MSPLDELPAKTALVHGKLDKGSSHLGLASNSSPEQNGAFSKLGMQQMRQTPRTTLELYRPSHEDWRVCDMLDQVFIYQSCSFTYIIAERHMSLYASGATTGAQRSRALQPSLSFESLVYFHSLSFL